MNILVKLLVGVLKKLVTERFFSRFIVLGLKTVSKSTKNTVDDEVCKIVGDALGNPCD